MTPPDHDTDFLPNRANTRPIEETHLDGHPYL